MKNILIDMAVDKKSLKKLRGLTQVQVEVTEDSEGFEGSRIFPAELIRDIHILFCEFPPANFQDMKAIEFIQISSAGYSQLYDLGLVEKKVRACNGLGVFDVPIAEWNIAMMINLARDLRGMIRSQEAGIWDRSARFQREIRGSVVGFWGYGSTARQTARLAKALGLVVHVLAPQKVKRRDRIYTVPGTGDIAGSLPDKIFVKGQEKEFLSGLDFLILAMPLTKQNKGIMGEEELRALPKHACLLNPARGPLVQEQALLKALGEGWIAGAALDTHHHYPMPADHPLWRFPNVIMTAHISGSNASQHFVARVWDIFMQNIERYLSAKPLLNELTTAQLNGG